MAIIGPGVTLGAGITLTSPPSIVTNGLLYNYDAATYSGTGNWIDSVQGAQAVPSYGPTWDGTAFTLDRTSSQYFTAPWPSFQPTYTVDVWFTMNGNQSSEAALICDSFQGGPMNFVICSGGSGGAVLDCGWFTTNWAYGQNSNPGGYTADGTTWYNLIMAVSSTGVVDYINGAVSNATQNPFNGGVSAPNGSGPDQVFWIGKSWSNQFYNGKVAVVNMYDRALSDAEVLQNFNYYRSRFGL
jgi:hypothetical protein